MSYIIKVTKEVPHIKYQLAEERVNDIVKYLNYQITNEKVQSGNSPFIDETNIFKQAIIDALEAYRGTICIEVDEEYSDEKIVDLNASIEAIDTKVNMLLNDSDLIDIQSNYAFKQMQENVIKLNEVKQKLIENGVDLNKLISKEVISDSIVDVLNNEDLLINPEM
jgi:hypothetical protein